MKPESKLLKYIVKEVIYAESASSILKALQSPEINFSRLKNLLLYHELAHFLYVIVNKYSFFLPDFFIFLKDTHFQQLSQYMRLHDELLNIAKEAKHKKLTFIPIKGFSYPERYYNRFGFRPLVDIDLLVKNNEFEKGVSLLQDLGYKKFLLGATEDYWKTKQCHLEFIKEDEKCKIILELHWALDFKRNKTEILPALWNRLRKNKLDNNEFYVMGPEDTLISLVLHQRRFGKMLNLKYICDAGILLENENLDWDYIRRSAYAGRFCASLFFFLAQTQIVLDKNLGEHLDSLHIPFWQRKSIFAIIRKYTYSSHKDFNLSYLYLACHFLLYDNIAESISYIIKIPQEQFAKFYRLPVYARQTKLCYRLRFIYIFYRLIKDASISIL